VYDYVRLYEAPEVDEEGRLVRKPTVVNEDGEDEEAKRNIKMKEGCMEVNVGIPLIVVVSKVIFSFNCLLEEHNRRIK
jgi:hypothetical protein